MKSVVASFLIAFFFAATVLCGYGHGCQAQAAVTTAHHQVGHVVADNAPDHHKQHTGFFCCKTPLLSRASAHSILARLALSHVFHGPLFLSGEVLPEISVMALSQGLRGLPDGTIVQESSLPVFLTTKRLRI